jgi:hypothetical protein
MRKKPWISLNYTDFGGKFGPPEADEVKKCAKTYVKKPKMRTNAHKYTWQGQKWTQNSMGNWGMLSPRAADGD